jgi:hypothetical protein
MKNKIIGQPEIFYKMMKLKKIKILEKDIK